MDSSSLAPPLSEVPTPGEGAGIPPASEGPPTERASAEAAPQANGAAEAISGSPSPKKGTASTLKKQVSSAFKFFGLAAR